MRRNLTHGKRPVPTPTHSIEAGSLSIKTDRLDALYSRGEEVVFHIEIASLGGAVQDREVEWKTSKDNAPPFCSGRSSIKNGRAEVSARLDEPGFLVCEVILASSKITATASAGIDVSCIEPSLPPPEDFPAFWTRKKQALFEMPMNPRLTEVDAPSDRPGVAVFDTQLDCLGGAPVSGYYARPATAILKSSPALLLLDGAGVRSTDILAPIRYAQNGILCLATNAHGVPNGREEAFYSDLDSGELKDYRVRGSGDREACYFVGMYLRVLRALQFLKAQAEWDGRILMVMGLSQGGGQAIAGAALEPKVTYTFTACPGLCDLAGAVAGRVAGWPKMVVNGPDGKPDPKILEATRYVDAVNMATLIQTPIHFYIGFLDKITPPTCQYAAYNTVKGPKSVENRPVNGHHHDDPDFWPMVHETIFQKVKEQQDRKPGRPRQE